MNNLQSLAVLLFIIFVIWVFDRKNFKREGIFFLRRTKKGLNFIDNFGRKHKRGLSIFGEIGIVFSFGALGLWYLLKEKRNKLIVLKSIIFFIMTFFILSYFLSYSFAGATALFGAIGFIFFYLAFMGYGILAGTVEEAGLQIVAPFQISGAPIFYVPVEYFLISIFILLLVHELSHAFVARAEGIKVKSVGYGLLAIIPLAFAEPDEKEMKKTESLKKSKVYSVGSFANILVGALCFILLLGAVSGVNATFQASGVEYKTTTENTPAYIALPEQGVITKINDNEVDSLLNMSQVMLNIKPNENINITVNGELYELVTMANPENETLGFMGITDLSTKVMVKEKIANIIGTKIPLILFYILELLKWLFLLNIGIGLANLLPLKPFDGGLMLEEILRKINVKMSKKVYNFIATLTLGLIILVFVGPYFIQALI